MSRLFVTTDYITTDRHRLNNLNNLRNLWLLLSARSAYFIIFICKLLIDIYPVPLGRLGINQIFAAIAAQLGVVTLFTVIHF